MQAIKTNKASVVTGSIAGQPARVDRLSNRVPLQAPQSHDYHSMNADFSANSIVLQSGQVLPADVIVAATG